MTAEIPKLALSSKSIPDEQKEKLRQLFPKFLRKIRSTGNSSGTLGTEFIEGKKERFGLTWPGKADCFRIIQEPSIGTLTGQR